MLFEKTAEKENIQNEANRLKDDLDYAEQTKYELMRILQQKEKLSLCLGDKIEHLEELRLDNARLKRVLVDVRNESEELIQHGLKYLDSAAKVSEIGR